MPEIFLDDLCTIEPFPGTDIARKITCREHGEVIYEITEKTTWTELGIAVRALEFHFDLRHGIRIKYAP